LKQILKYTLIIVVLSLLCFLVACRPEALAPEEPQLLVLDPAAESTLFSDSATISVFVENFELVEAGGQPDRTGQGHLVYYLDITPPLVKGQSALSQDGTFSISSQKTCQWHNLSPGQHNLWVQLVNNDNTPLEPPVAVRVPVTIALP
jgi:hypothetical protein